eukprot:TRINITY_DN408_c0_g1_i4.p1 TRINITY_DN408_c0_g1~~TRINITY_DN408_c0_g1_i4.p1  ORF type:complete len:187 (+),score=24.35 TRINITY_DN408_c0_g1_i4:141-701(+)
MLSRTTSTPAPAGPSATPSAPKKDTSAASAAPKSASGLEVGDLGKVLASLGVESDSGPELLDVLKADNLKSIVSDKSVQERLFPLLPEHDRSVTGLEDVLRNPQYQQAVRVLQAALQSGHLSTILRELKVDPSKVGSATGVPAFLKALEIYASEAKGKTPSPAAETKETKEPKKDAEEDDDLYGST